jgi:hypothetical protein
VPDEARFCVKKDDAEMGKYGGGEQGAHFFIDGGASIGKWVVPGVFSLKNQSDPDHRDWWH